MTSKAQRSSVVVVDQRPGEEDCGKDAGNTNAIVSIVSEINRYDIHVPGASFKRQNPKNFHCEQLRRSRVGVVVRALAFHQCVPGSIPGLGVICGLSLLVLYSAPRSFFSGYSGFPLSPKTSI